MPAFTLRRHDTGYCKLVMYTVNHIITVIIIIIKVYEEIAGHFSDTRHTPWPRVVEFLNSAPNGSLVADVGCGNGKYLCANKNTIKVRKVVMGSF